MKNTTNKTGGFMYFIYDENGELMRKTRYKAEAKRLVSIYTDWTYRYVKPIKKSVDFSIFAFALF